MNPPYARGVIDLFADRLLAEVQAHPTLQAAVLTNAATTSGWWKRLARRSDAVVFFGSRLAFIDGDTGKPVHGNAMGQTLFLFRQQYEPWQFHSADPAAGTMCMYIVDTNHL
jgi:hypothetical protein